MEIDLTGRTAVVTGAARGIGAAIAEELARSGAAVTIADIDLAVALERARKLAGLGLRSRGAAVDITDDTSVDAMVTGAVDAFGEVDILINNAGISAPAHTLELTSESWRRTVDVNLTGAFLCSRRVLGQMRDRGWGRIVNVVSFAAKSAPIYADNASYAASKAGLVGLIHNLAAEFGPDGVTVNGVAPGIVDTELLRAAHDEVRRRELVARVPVGRFTAPEEVAALVTFLASEFAASITGEIVNINGGLYFD